MLASLILVPFMSVIFLNAAPTQGIKKFAFWWSLLLFIAQTIIALFFYSSVFYGSFSLPSHLFNFSIIADNLALVMLFCIGIVLLVTILVGARIIKEENRKFNFVNLLLLALAGMNGIVLVRDIFSLYVFIEITAVTTYILIAFDNELKALSAVFKYIVLSMVASVLMLLAIALLLFISGSTDFTVIHTALKNSPHGLFIMFAVGMFLCGLFTKAGLVPFHGWLPDAYTQAPAATSILLAGIVSKALGVYTLIRIVTMVFIFDKSINSVLLFVGTISIIIGALAALGQNDFKRMLAYSSISQVGYIIIGLGCATPLGIAGAILHLFNHSIFKSLLFVNAATLHEQVGTTDMEKMGGLAAKMPITGVTSVVASLSAAGIPPLAGFWSKLMIVTALWVSGQYIYAVIAVLASVLTLAYLLNMQRMVFFGKLRLDLADTKEAGFNFTFPALILTVITVGVGLLFPFVSNAFVSAMGRILYGN